jgi:hypothetical protein
MKTILCATCAVILMALVAGHVDCAADPLATVPADASLDVQYAKVKLELANANLKKVVEMNRRIARTVSPDVVAEYRNDAALAKLRLDGALKGNSDTYSFWLKAAELNWKSAHAAWQSAVAANDQQRGSVDELDVERLHLQAEVFRIGLDRGQALANQPREAQLEWRLRMLSDEVARLSDVVFRGTPSPGRSGVGLYYYAPQRAR